MIDLELYPIFKSYKKSLHDLSVDDSDKENIQYMTDSRILAIDFDTVKTSYANNLKLSEEVADSVDAVLPFQDGIGFIEFKNGDMKNEKRKVKDKARDSLLIFCGITDKTISYTREHVNLVLVYNIAKNPRPNQLKKCTPQESESRDFIAKTIAHRANEEYVRFGLDRFKTLYFRHVHTYTESEFEEYLKLCVNPVSC